ncbi:MAG: putative oxidoreductase [Pseudonocardiales bacterium]|nr:putative oxidoreductase [Pseudonocardiales bacterium]
MLCPLSGPVRDVALLVARVLLGVVLVAHGAQKLFSYGFDGTSGAFAKMGVPLPQVSAAYASVVELVGGGLLILGAATTIVSALVVLDMLGASLTTGSFTSIFVASHGFELEGMILVGALLLLVIGAGRFSIDHLLLSRRGVAVTT